MLMTSCIIIYAKLTADAIPHSEQLWCRTCHWIFAEIVTDTDM